MNFSFWGRKKQEKFLVLDIGTEAVKVLVIEKKKEQSVLVSANLEYLRSSEWQEPLKTIESVLSANRKFLAESNVLLSLPPRILGGRIVYSSFVRQKNTGLISDKESIKIIEEILNRAKRETIDQTSLEWGILPKDIHFFSLKLFAMKIDGYEIPDIKGYDGKVLSFGVLAVFLLQDYLKGIERIFKSFGVKHFKLTHLAEWFLEPSGFYPANSIFLDIGGDNTAIFFVKNNKLYAMDKFEIGGRNFSRTISFAFGINETDARLLKENYTKKLLSPDAQSKMFNLFVDSKKEWYKNLESRITDKMLSPGLFVFGGGGTILEIEEILEERAESNDLAGRRAKFIYPDDLRLSIRFRDEGLRHRIMRDPQYVSCFMLYAANQEDR